MKYPENIKTWKQKTAYWFFYQWYTRSVGQGQIIGRFTNMLPEVGWLVVFLEKFTPITFKAWSIITLFVGSFVLNWAMGWYWMRLGLDRIESLVSVQRNQAMRDIYKNIVKEVEEIK